MLPGRNMQEKHHEIHEIAISTIIPADYNPRKLTEKEYADLKESLQGFGFVDPVIVNQHPDRLNILVGGHQRVKVWQDMGNKTVPAVFVSLTKEKERELNIRLNRNNGSWSWEMLEANFSPNELTQWGFTEKDLFGHFKSKTTGDDEAPDLSKATSIVPGDLFQLGPHRIMCGDSTQEKDIDRLMDGAKADLVFTDPPYNVNYTGQGKDTSRTIENDNMESGAFRDFLNKVFVNYSILCSKNASIYCCYASRTHREFEDAINQAGYEVQNQIIWVKTVASMGWGNYRWKHEPMLYCRRTGSSPEFYGDRKQYTTWDEATTEDELIASLKARIKREEAGGSTVWRFPRDGNYKHPTQKPVDLVTRAIENSSKRGQIVTDLFMGSGTTLIASEKTERIAYGMEMDPLFVDVIVNRYAEFCIKNNKKWCVLLNGQDISGQYGTNVAGKEQQ